MTDRSKIRGRGLSGVSVQEQREVANAIKNAREMALLPYTKRVSQTRAGRPPRDGDDRRERGPRRDEAAATDVDAAVETTESVESIESIESEVEA